MKLKSLFLALAISSTQVRSDESHSFSNDQSRDLQKKKNENCDLSGEISCNVIADGTDCSDLNIRIDQCKELPVMMNYTFCNNEQVPEDKIIVLPSISYTNLYEISRKPLSFSTLQAGSCKSELRREIVDTCKRNRVNGDMKLEGWKTFKQNFGSYCHVYKHYFPKINKFTLEPTSPPLPAPTFNVAILCFLEDLKGSKNFIVPCDDMNIQYFSDSFTNELFNYERNVQYQFIIQSSSSETIKVDDIIVVLDNDRFIVEVPEDSVFIPEGKEVKVAEFTKEVDFSEFSGEQFELSSEITVTGLKSGQTISKSTVEAFTVPVIEFGWKLTSFKCVIRGTNQACEDYLRGLPSLDNPDLCNVDVEYEYKVENDGEVCEDIVDVLSIADGKRVSVPTSSWEFCPGETISIFDSRKENLCAYAEREVDFGLRLNGIKGSPTANSLVFPKPAGIGPKLKISNIRCEIRNSNPKRTCADYIKFQQQENLPCVTNVVYRSKVQNTGDFCIDIKKLKLGVDGTLLNINMKNWIPEKKNLCSNEKLHLKKNVIGADLCALADREVDIQVIATDKTGFEVDDFGSIPFPKPNTVTPPPAPSSCTSKPNSITIKLNRDVCADCSNSQGIKTSRKLNSQRKKGKGTKPESCECKECHDGKTDITSMAAPPLVIISKKNTDGSTMELFKGEIDFFTEFVFTPPSMPDCLQVDIREVDGRYTRQAQVVGFDMTCSSDSPLYVGDSFGAVEIVKIN